MRINTLYIRQLLYLLLCFSGSKFVFTNNAGTGSVRNKQVRTRMCCIATSLERKMQALQNARVLKPSGHGSGMQGCRKIIGLSTKRNNGKDDIVIS